MCIRDRPHPVLMYVLNTVCTTYTSKLRKHLSWSKVCRAWSDLKWGHHNRSYRTATTTVIRQSGWNLLVGCQIEIYRVVSQKEIYPQFVKGYHEMFTKPTITLSLIITSITKTNPQSVTSVEKPGLDESGMTMGMQFILEYLSIKLNISCPVQNTTSITLVYK